MKLSQLLQKFLAGHLLLVSESPTARIYRACKEAFGWTGRKGFFDRMRLVHLLEIRSICDGWEFGLGPGGRSYRACSHRELLGLLPVVDAPF